MGPHALIPPGELPDPADSRILHRGKGVGVLQPGGHLVTKVLDGAGVPELCAHDALGYR